MPTKLCWKSGIDRAIATLATSPGPSDWLKTSCSQHRERRKAVNPSATKPSRLVKASWDYLIPSRYEASIRFQTFFQHMLLPKNFFVGNRKGRFTVKDISCDVRQSQWLRDSVTKKTSMYVGYVFQGPRISWCILLSGDVWAWSWKFRMAPSSFISAKCHKSWDLTRSDTLCPKLQQFFNFHERKQMLCMGYGLHRYQNRW